MKNLLFTLLIIVATIFDTFAQTAATAPNDSKVLSYAHGSRISAEPLMPINNNAATTAHLEIPRTRASDIITHHAGYSLLYNESHEQAKWVAYELTGIETRKVASRTNKFLPDPLVKTISANDRDYAGSGYDRGHLAPAGDMVWSATAMAESFYYSNMSPQVPAFNRGIWKRLEEMVRTWAKEYQAVYVVTGPVLTKGLPVIGPDDVSVPEYFYKVILDYTGPDIKGIGFIMPNAGSGYPLQNYAVTIDSVEKFTGIDFFPSLPDQQERQIENSLCIPCWSWSSTKTAGTKTDGVRKSSIAVQCHGTTKAGTRCKKRTLNPSGYCYLHER